MHTQGYWNMFSQHVQDELELHMYTYLFHARTDCLHFAAAVDLDHDYYGIDALVV